MKGRAGFKPAEVRARLEWTGKGAWFEWTEEEAWLEWAIEEEVWFRWVEGGDKVSPETAPKRKKC